MKNILGFAVGLSLGLLAFQSIPSVRADFTAPWLESLPGVGKTTHDDIEPVDILLDGPTFRDLIEAMLEGTPDGVDDSDPQEGGDHSGSHAIQVFLDDLLPQVMWVHLKGTHHSLNIEFQFERPFDASLSPVKDTKWMSLYAFHLPEHFTYQATYQYPSIRIRAVDNVWKAPSLFIRIPLLPDQVFLHWVKYDPIGEKIQARAGILWDLVKFNLNFQMFKKKKVRSLEAPAIDRARALYAPLLKGLLEGTWTRSR
jgi:hypothetical protein